MRLERISDALPSKYAFSHRFAFVLHDTLAGYLVDGRSSGRFSVNVDVKPSSGNGLPLGDEDVLAWLERTGRSDVLGELLHRTLFAAVLGDACHFLYEALRCSEKGKLTVAYALLRKPLKESLYFLEMLLGEPDWLINTFYNRPTSDLALDKVAYRNKAVPVIQKAISRTQGTEMYDAEFLWQVRFDKHAQWGLERLWNKAQHLITDRPPLATERQNLNLVFSEADALASQWRGFYELVPFLLYYMVDVATSLMLWFEPEVDFDATPWVLAKVHRDIGFMLWADDRKAFAEDASGFSARMPADFGYRCPSCARGLVFSRKQMLALFDGRQIACRQCRARADLEALVKEG